MLRLPILSVSSLESRIKGRSMSSIFPSVKCSLQKQSAVTCSHLAAVSRRNSRILRCRGKLSSSLNQDTTHTQSSFLPLTFLDFPVCLGLRGPTRLPQPPRQDETRLGRS